MLEIRQQEWSLDRLANWSRSKQTLVQSFHWLGSDVDRCLAFLFGGPVENFNWKIRWNDHITYYRQALVLGACNQFRIVETLIAMLRPRLKLAYLLNATHA